MTHFFFFLFCFVSFRCLFNVAIQGDVIEPTPDYLFLLAVGICRRLLGKRFSLLIALFLQGECNNLIDLTNKTTKKEPNCNRSRCTSNIPVYFLSLFFCHQKNGGGPKNATLLLSGSRCLSFAFAKLGDTTEGGGGEGRGRGKRVSYASLSLLGSHLALQAGSKQTLKWTVGWKKKKKK